MEMLILLICLVVLLILVGKWTRTLAENRGRKNPRAWVFWGVLFFPWTQFLLWGLFDKQAKNETGK
jgi:hypothetical protein